MGAKTGLRGVFKRGLNVFKRGLWAGGAGSGVPNPDLTPIPVKSAPWSPVRGRVTGRVRPAATIASISSRCPSSP